MPLQQDLCLHVFACQKHHEHGFCLTSPSKSYPNGSMRQDQNHIHNSAASMRNLTFSFSLSVDQEDTARKKYGWANQLEALHLDNKTPP